MFDIGFQELAVIFLVALLVLGPEKLPEVGRLAGKWMIEIRKAVQNAKFQMESEFQGMEEKTGSDGAGSQREEKKDVEKEQDSEEIKGKT